MILTDKTIIDEIALKNIVIEPLIEANIGTNSVDLTLSNTLLMYTDTILDTRKKNAYAPFIIPEEGIILRPNVIPCLNRRIYGNLAPCTNYTR